MQTNTKMFYQKDLIFSLRRKTLLNLFKIILI